jgi:hypothetical protein
VHAEAAASNTFCLFVVFLFWVFLAQVTPYHISFYCRCCFFFFLFQQAIYCPFFFSAFFFCVCIPSFDVVFSVPLFVSDVCGAIVPQRLRREERVRPQSTLTLEKEVTTHNKEEARRGRASFFVTVVICPHTMR